MYPSMYPVVRIDAAALRRMYVDQRMTTTEIAARLECGSTTVTPRLREIGIPRRSRGPSSSPDRRGPAGHPEWSPDIAWVVGLIAPDGNLAGTGRSISITSKDTDLLESARRCLALSNRLLRVVSSWSAGGYRLQWRNRAFYDRLVAVGLTPRKSLTIGPLAVPDEYFADFFRGCIDGDGTVLVYVDRYHADRKASYVYARLYVSLVSASRPFVDWLRATIYRLLGLAGEVQVKRTPTGRQVWNLRYAKRASVRLLRFMYYSPSVPCLARKRAKAEPFLCGTE
jgi:hypothetical protein